ncbi:hypothetical protein [Aquimarina latercula]|uniref:hypothetical protein n=1 Tax=Aquimarina latercula TaxID=987 RepID=UPI0003F7FE08|nr:hypothetical protein [Aquimarina latercula]
MKTLIYILVILLSLGCISRNENSNKLTVLNNDLKLNKPESVQFTESKVSQNEIDLFIKKLKTQPIQSLPFEMDSYLLESNNFKGDYFNWLENLTIEGRINKFPDLNNAALTFNKSIETDYINKITAPYFDSYYYLLINESNISSFHFDRRLKPINDNIEVFLNKSIITKSENEVRGMILKLNVFDIKKKKILTSYILRISGIGLNDESYIEGFLIDEHYNINIKSYTSVEGEATEIVKKIKVISNGNLSTETINGKITSKEKGEVFIEKFSKEIDH